MPETLEAPAADTPEARFEAALQANPMPGAEAAPDPIPGNEPPAPTAAPAPKHETTAVDDSIPAEFLTGEKPKPAEAKDADIERLMNAEPPPQLRSEAAKESFKTWKADAAKAIEARNARIAELEKATAGAKPSEDGEQLKALLKQHQERAAELEALVERTNFERSPKFQKFVKAEQGALDGAKSYLQGTEIPAGVIDMAAGMAGPQRIRVLRDAGMDAETIAAIAPYLAQVDTLRRERTEALEDAKGTAAQWQAEQDQARQQKEAQRQAEETRVFKEVGEEVAKEFEPFQKIPGNDKWNAQVDQLNAEAEQFFQGEIPLRDVAKIARYGVGAKVLHSMFTSLRTKYQAVVAERDSLKAAQPDGGSLTNTNRATQPENAIDRSVQEFERLMAGR